MAKPAKRPQQPTAPQPPAPAQFTPPSHAMPCWLEYPLGVPSLCIGVPSKSGREGGHTLRVALTDPQNAVALLRKVLADYAAAPRGHAIGAPGLPVQSMLDALAQSQVRPLKCNIKASNLDEDDFADWTPPTTR